MTTKVTPTHRRLSDGANVYISEPIEGTSGGERVLYVKVFDGERTYHMRQSYVAKEYQPLAEQPEKVR